MFHLQEKVREALAHGLISFLFSLGLTLTLLGVTGLLAHGWLAAALLAAANGVAAAAGLNRRIALGGGCVLLFAGVIWLLIGGAGLMNETMQALLLHMSGLTTALPMVGVPFTAVISLLCVAVSWFVTQRNAGAFPALILLVLAAVLLWLGNWPEVLICLLPAVIACVTLLLRSGNDHTGTIHVLPLAVVVTGIAFTGVAAGGVSATPLKEFADSIRQRIYDTFFFTQPRDVFSLASEGYYPQGLSQLGGPAEPREVPVMAVITPRKTYLRGVVKNVYTGRTWTEDIGGRRYLWSASRFDELRQKTFDLDLPMLGGTTDAAAVAVRMLQVRMLRDSASTLFVPQRIRSLSAEGDLTPYFNASSEIFATSNLKVGDVWTMEAAIFTANDKGVQELAEAAASADDPNWSEVCDTYLQLPEHLEREVYSIASEAIRGAETPFEKALALQHYLAANYSYTLDAAVQNPEQDFVSTFLLIDKKGYCTYFASAMTVLCRMVGLPARYVEGYVAYPDVEGLAVVTGKEGHAWTEVYLRGFGWVTFDATPTSAEYISYNEPENPGDKQDQPPEEAPTPTPEPTSQPEELATPTPEPEAEPEQQPVPTPSPQPEPHERETPQEKSGSGILWVIAAILLLLLLLVRLILVQPGVQAARRSTEFGCWLIWTQAIHDVLRRHGLTRNQAETTTAFFERAEASGKLNISLRALCEAENVMFYGHAAPLEEEIQASRNCYKVLYRALSFRQKLVFQLQRVFLSGKKYDITAR